MSPKTCDLRELTRNPRIDIWEESLPGGIQADSGSKLLDKDMQGHTALAYA